MTGKDAAPALERKEGDVVRQIVVTETTYVWRINLDGSGDFYPEKQRTIAVAPSWKELGVDY